MSQLDFPEVTQTWLQTSHRGPPSVKAAAKYSLDAGCFAVSLKPGFYQGKGGDCLPLEQNCQSYYVDIDIATLTTSR